MAQYSRIEVANVMKENGLVPLFFHSNVEIGKKILKACYDGGARLLEFTSRGDFAFEIFGELNKYTIKELPGMILGVGSVTDAAAASVYMQLGANFVVTPVLREDIAVVCNRRKVLWSPGCGSLTEIVRAEELGCEIVKLFPGGTYGPGRGTTRHHARGHAVGPGELAPQRSSGDPVRRGCRRSEGRRLWPDSWSQLGFSGSRQELPPE